MKLLKRLRLFKIRHLFQNRALVLMYHRIYSPVTDPWQISVSPENFRAHMQVLRDHYRVVSVDELVRQVQSGYIENGCVALTFDDGYRDNFETAKPLLEEYAIPATFFITDSYLDSKLPFWWDELEHIIVHTPKLPPTFSVPISGKAMHYDLGDEAELNDELRARHAGYKSKAPPTLRTRLYIRLFEVFTPLLTDEQQRLLDDIREWAGLDREQTRLDSGMSTRQLRSLSKHELFTIGGHSRTHPALSSHPAEVQNSEILENKRFLEAALDKTVTQFAYPSGRFDDSTVMLLEEHGYTAAFTTFQDPIVKNTDLLRAGRIHIKDWNGPSFRSALEKRFRQ